MKTTYRIILLSLLLGAAFTVRAQREPLPGVGPRDTLYLPKWEPHLSVGTGFFGTSRGDNRLFTTVAPSLKYRPNDKLTIGGGFRMTSDLGLNPNYFVATQPQSLAPLKRNGGTTMASAHLEAQYQVSDNVWLAASLYHVGGTYAPVYGFGNGQVFDVSATAISASAAFRFKNDNFLHISVTYMRDHYGTLPFLFHDAWMQSCCGPWGFCASPSDYYRFAAPYGPMFYGGWF